LADVDGVYVVRRHHDASDSGFGYAGAAYAPNADAAA
ncbi:MAG: hypothetical protein K0Q73_2761, partial [Paenibacillus sp.]|nr:hypothetical protein [Paenibacillus sp.]